MSSLLSYIKAQLLVDIETTSIVAAFDGLGPTECKDYPYAELAMVQSTTDLNITQVYDRVFAITLWIVGTSPEQVELAIEELSRLWCNQARLGVLQLLGVVLIVCTGQGSPLPLYGSTTNQFQGTVDYEMRVRYSYSS